MQPDTFFISRESHTKCVNGATGAMPSLLSSLEEVITEDYTAVKVNNLLEER
jgi:hypothetical protein